MQQFAQQSGRAGSPKPDRPRSANRQRAAANAKVPVTRTVLSHHQPAQQQQPQITIRRTGSGPLNHPVANQPTRRRPSNQGVHVKQDPYDTDPDSLDTTQGPQSFIQNDVRGNHRHQHEEQFVGEDQDHGTDAHEHSEYESGDGEGSDDGEEDEYEFDEDEVNVIVQKGYQDATNDEKVNLLYDLGMRQPNYNDRYGGGESYPPTTSGNPTELSHEVKGESSPESVDDERAMSPTPQRPSKRQPLRPGSGQAFYRPGSTSAMVPPVHRQSMFQQGAAIRGQHRPEVNAKGRPGQIPNSQLPTYSQAVLPPATALPTNTRAPQHARTQSQAQLPQHGAQLVANRPHTQAPQRIKPGPQAETPAPDGSQAIALAPTPAPTIQEPEVEVEAETEASETENRPVEDYDLPDLFEKKYEELKNEDFDTDPRAPDSVLPEDILSKSLVDRLKHAQDNLNADDKAKFCATLPTAEWENAGDWFLDQFTNIITRTREARQTKRKLAKEFEAEVEKRHKHIAKKRSQVEEALGAMQRQGQGLIPKSPRKSKSPG